MHKKLSLWTSVYWDYWTYTVKVWNDLIENSQTLDAAVVYALFSVEIRKIRDGGKHHTYFIIGLAVEFL